MDRFENEDCRTLKKFLEHYIGFPMMMFDEWVSIRSFEYNREVYYNVHYPTTRMIFHVAPIEQRTPAIPMQDPQHTVDVTVHKSPIPLFQKMVGCITQLWETITQSLINTMESMEFNSFMTCMFDSEDYQELFRHLQVHGQHEDEIHQYLFRQLVHEKYAQRYDEDQRYNYDYIHTTNMRYLVMWYEY